MSEDNNEGFPGVQVSTYIRGDHYVFRGEDGVDLGNVLKTFEENANDLTEQLNAIKQAVVAKAIFTGESQKTSTGGAVSRGERAKDKPPPKGDGDITFYTNDDGVKVASLECEHGPMLDLRGKNYKFDLYCSGNFPKSEWKKQCKAVEL